MTPEKNYTITLPQTMWNVIVNHIDETMSGKAGRPIIEAIRQQAIEQDTRESKKELTKVADEIAPKK